MNLTMKFPGALGLAVLALAALLGTSYSKGNPYEDKCNTELVRAYGFVGRTVPTAAPLEMCPGIQQSCCLKKDQLMMYNQWVKLKENEFIKRRYNHNTMEYIKFLNILHKADKVIEDIESKLTHRKISNCKELAKRIAAYEIPQLVPVIRKNLNNMRDFMVKAFEGFYCTICDHENHTHIDVKKKTVTYSEAFCRSTIEHTLSPMLFFHVDIVKYVNMVSKFMVSCDFKGDYESEALIPKKHIFYQFDEDAHKLNDCRDNRNKKEWMAYCNPVCQNFSMVTFNLFWEPNIEKVEAYVPWLEEQIHHKKTEHLKHPMFAEKKPKKLRILSGEAKGGDAKAKPAGKSDDQKGREAAEKLGSLKHMKSKQEPMIKYTRPEILDVHVFKSKMTSKVDLTGYTVNFADDGLSPYEFGTNSVITDNMYYEVKTVIHLSNMTKKSSSLGGMLANAIGMGNGLTAKDKKELDKIQASSFSRSLISAGRLSCTLLLASVVMVMGLFK